MKQLLILFIAIFFTEYTSKAQAEFGITGGANFSNFYGDVIDGEPKTRIGGNFGLYSNVNVANKISLEPSLLFTMMGAVIEDAFEENTYVLDYVALPLAINFEASEGVGIYLAPQVGFAVRREIFAEISGEKETESVKNIFKDIDFGLRTGVNYTSPSGIGGGVGYYLGIADILELKDVDETIRNNGFNVNLRYHFY